MGTPFRAGDRMHLVDDDVLDAAEDLAGLAREHQVEAFGCRDEDVRRVAGDLAAVLARGVAGAARDADVRRRLAPSLGREPDPGQRRPKIALHVVGQRLERGDVEDPDVAGLGPGGRRAGIAGEAVQAPQEGGQGLATPRRRVDERVLPRADRRPAFHLRLGRRLETRLEPVADRRGETSERVGFDDRGHGTASIGGATCFDQAFYIGVAHPATPSRRRDPCPEPPPGARDLVPRPPRSPPSQTSADVLDFGRSAPASGHDARYGHG